MDYLTVGKAVGMNCVSHGKNVDVVGWRLSKEGSLGNGGTKRPSSTIIPCVL